MNDPSVFRSTNMTIGVDQNDQMPSLRKNGGGGGGIPNKDIIMARNMGFPNMKYLDPEV